MARMSSTRENGHRRWVDTRSLAGSRRLASAHRHAVPGAFRTARSWLKASHYGDAAPPCQKQLTLPETTDDNFRHVRSHSEAAIMARNSVPGSILPKHLGCWAQNWYRTPGMGVLYRA